VGDFRDPEVAASWHAAQLGHPARGEQLDLLLTVAQRMRPAQVLDAGVGSGLVAVRLLERLPAATLVGVDHSTAMLDRARERLAPFRERVRLVQADLARPETIALPDGRPFDLAITVQTLHNVDPAGQRIALRWIGRCMGRRGTLLSLDKLAVPATLWEHYAAFGHLPPTHAEYVSAEAAAAEHAPSLETFLGWLRSAGFEPAVLDLRANYGLVAARAAG
jgi:ubiquinone/menaquinone biosynthesis C-methylase UbiE